MHNYDYCNILRLSVSRLRGLIVDLLRLVLTIFRYCRFPLHFGLKLFNIDRHKTKKNNSSFVVILNGLNFQRLIQI